LQNFGGVLDTVPTESLVAKLAKLGPDTDQETINTIIARGEEAVSYLARIALDEEYWNVEGEHSIWSSICAIHLLAVLGGKQSIQAIDKAIRIHCDETADWLTEDMPSVLPALGSSAFEMLAGMIEDGKLDEFVRVGAAGALLMISKSDEMTRTKSVNLLKDVIAKENKKFARTMLLDQLIEFKDKDSLEFVKSFFERRMVDEMHLPYSEVLAVYSGEYDHLQHDVGRDPLDIFKHDPHNFYWETHTTYTKYEQEVTDKYQNSHVGETACFSDRCKYGERVLGVKQKVGRNDPCPCGSGMKYKKWCLRL
jgi:hypothetical protein